MTKTISFRNQILLLCILPILLVSGVLTALSIINSQKLGKKNIEEFSHQMLEIRQSELKHYLQIATSAVRHAYNSNDYDEEQAQSMAKAILRDLAYGEDGYFFVYDYEGRNVVHPKKPHLEGKNLWSLQDRKGTYLIRELISEAKTGSNQYTQYVWDRPSTGEPDEKLSFSVGLERWRWMIGTGLYLDDLEQAAKLTNESIVSNTQNITLITISISLIFTIIVTFIATRFTVSQGRFANQKLQRLSKISVRERGQERVETAQSIHSDVINGLSLAVQKLMLIKNDQPKLTIEESEDESASVSQLSHKKVKEIVDLILLIKKNAATIANELHPSTLVKEGIFVAIEQFANALTEKSNIKIKVSIVNTIDRPPVEVETICYRIVQEALENILLHSKATEASIRLRQTRHVLSLTIQDNGVGFDPGAAAIYLNERGIGLSDMQLQTELLHGSFTLFSSEGTGTMIKVALPLTGHLT